MDVHCGRGVGAALLFTGTERMLGLVTASQIASASFASFLPRLRQALTPLAGPRGQAPSNSRTQLCGDARLDTDQARSEAGSARQQIDLLRRKADVAAMATITYQNSFSV